MFLRIGTSNRVRAANVVKFTKLCLTWVSRTAYLMVVEQLIRHGNKTRMRSVIVFQFGNEALIVLLRPAVLLIRIAVVQPLEHRYTYSNKRIKKFIRVSTCDSHARVGHISYSILNFSIYWTERSGRVAVDLLTTQRSHWLNWTNCIHPLLVSTCTFQTHFRTRRWTNGWNDFC